MSGKRQQKQPPATSSTHVPAALRTSLSTRSAAWSLATRPTRLPCPVKRRAACARSVVLPAPRKPPTRTSRGRPLSPFVAGSESGLLPSPSGRGRARCTHGRGEGSPFSSSIFSRSPRIRSCILECGGLAAFFLGVLILPLNSAAVYLNWKSNGTPVDTRLIGSPHLCTRSVAPDNAV